MKTIIAGSRNINNVNLKVSEAVYYSGIKMTEIVSGTARGVDQAGELFGHKNNIPVKRFPAEWERLGRGAGYIRNSKMADYADALIAVWDGVSKGTKHMIEEARKRNLTVFVYEVKQ